MNQLSISGKDLGELALPDFCDRCFWIKRKAEGLPFQIFPGIFSSIDSYSKKLVHSWFDRHKSLPTWLGKLGNIVRYRSPPHYTKFATVDEPTKILLRGSPDAVFEFADGSILIGDYKTAKYTEAQDALLPIYRTQLNAYAAISERIGYARVSQLALIYTEPVTDSGTVENDGNHSNDGFTMAFSAHILPIELNVAMIPPLLERMRKLLDLLKPPVGRIGCKDCRKLDSIVTLMT